MIARLLPLFLGALLLAPSSAAQSLDGAWFQLSVSAKGVMVMPDGSTVNGKGKLKVYMQLTLAGEGQRAEVPGTYYDYIAVSEPVVDDWQVTSSGSLFVPADEKALLPAALGPENAGVRLVLGTSMGSAEDEIVLDFIGKLKVKTDKSGTLKKASFSSLGAVVPEGTIEGVMICGGAKVKGKTVPLDKLPFALP